MKRLVGIVILTLVTIGLTACGSSSSVYYQPSAWGPYGYCYYVYSPYECYGHHYGTPVLMPLWWHQRYAAYYDSPAYYNAYVPGRYRSTYVTQAHTFERTYSRQIGSSSRYASYKSSSGKVISGSKLGGSAVFGGGGARSRGFSSGARVNSSGSPCAALPNHILLAGIFIARGGGSSGGGGHASSGGGSSHSGGYGGGSARSGSTGSKSGSRSGRSC